MRFNSLEPIKGLSFSQSSRDYLRRATDQTFVRLMYIGRIIESFEPRMNLVAASVTSNFCYVEVCFEPQQIAVDCKP